MTTPSIFSSAVAYGMALAGTVTHTLQMTMGMGMAAAMMGIVGKLVLLAAIVRIAELGAVEDGDPLGAGVGVLDVLPSRTRSPVPRSQTRKPSAAPLRLAR